MKFGILFRPEDPPMAEHIARRWQEILRATEVAEEVGFDGVFVPEHHMFDDGHLPSPLIACAALAARTTTIEIGTTILLLPFYNPIHVAEDAAMVDVLSGGRLRLGVGLGAAPREFDLFDVNMKSQVSRFEEGVDLIRRAWAGEKLDHHGRHFNATGWITPAPNSAQLWMGAISEPGVERAARLGTPWITDSFHNVAILKEFADRYRAAGAAAGTSDSLGVVLMRDGWVADSMEEVEQMWWPFIKDKHWEFFHGPQAMPDREPGLQDIDDPESFPMAAHGVDRLVVGSPEDCIATIRRFRELIDMDYLVISFRLGPGPDHESELKALRRFGEEVIPAFR